MVKFTKSLRSIFNLNGLFIQILFYTMIIFSLEIYQAIPTKLVDDQFSLPANSEISISNDNPNIFGGSRPDLFQGQKFSIKLLSQSEINISIQQIPFKKHASNYIYLNYKTVTFLDQTFDVQTTGDIKIIISSLNSEDVLIDLQIIRQGFPEPLLIYFIIMFGFLIITSFQIKKKSIIPVAKEFIHQNNSQGKFVDFKTYSSYFSYHQIAIAVIIPSLLISIDPQIHPFNSGSIYSISQNGISEDSNFQNTLYFSGFMLQSILLFVIYALPITLFNLSYAEVKKTNQNERVYPLNRSLFNITRILSFTLYLTIIPILDFLVRVLISLYYKTLDISFISIILSILLVETIVCLLLAVYFMLFDFTANIIIKLVTPVIIFSIFSGFSAVPLEERPFYNSILNFDDFSNLFIKLIQIFSLLLITILVNIKFTDNLKHQLRLKLHI